MEKKSINKKVILIFSLVFIIILGLVLLFWFVINNKKKEVEQKVVKVENVDITTEIGSIYLGDELELEVSYSPSDSTNAKFVWSSSDENIASVENGKIQAKRKGNATICVSLKDDENIKDCKDFNIILKVDEFVNNLINKFGYKKVDGNDYVLRSGSTTGGYYEFNFINQTLTYADSSLNYVYHYKSGYIDGYHGSGKYKADIMYYPDTDNFSCVGNSVLAHEAMCSYSLVFTTKTTLQTLVRFFESYLNDYTVEDLTIY